MTNKSYKEFSQVYDLLMDDVDYEKWTSFIINHINNGKKILEAACGTGNITSRLAQQGYKLTAFDLSSDMLMRAYEKLGRNQLVKFINLDMRNFKIDDKFDTAICCCDGVNYLTMEEVRTFFSRIYDHLNNNSNFIFDISTLYKYNQMFNDNYVYDDENIFYVWENNLDLSNNTVGIEINFFIKEGQNKYSRITEEQTQYIHSLGKIESLLSEVGFVNIKIFDDYCEKKIEEISTRAVFCATKI